eukprot:jgi/Orpsp1_1/1179005/evm.model.c7180000067538.1
MSNPLPSYYINTADSNVYIKCTNFGCEIIQKPKETKTCTSDEDRRSGSEVEKDFNDEPGYYKMGGTNKYRQCDNNSCILVTLETECKNSSVGKLFIQDGKVAFYLNFFDGEPIWTYATTTGKYLLKYHASNNIFNLLDNQYELIKITKNTTTISEDPKNIRYRYTIEDHKVLTKKNCVSSEVNKFKLVKGEKNIHTLRCNEKDTTGL